MLKENRHSQFYIRFHREYGNKLDCNSLTEIADFFDFPLSIIEQIFERGESAYEIKQNCTNEKINTKQYHGLARVYRLVLNVIDLRTGRKKYKNMRVLIDRDMVKRLI